MKFKDKFNLKTLKKAIMLMNNEKKRFLVCMILFCVVELMCTAFEAAGMKGIINGLMDKNINMFWNSLYLIIFKCSLWWIYAPISSYLCSKSSINTMREYKSSFFEHILKLPMSTHDKKTTAQYIANLTGDMEGLNNIYSNSFFQVLESFIVGIGGVIVMLYMDYKFAIIIISFGFLFVTISAKFSDKLKNISQQRQINLDKTTTNIYELIKAGKTIRTLNIQNDKENDIEKSLDEEKNIKQKFCNSIAKMNSCEILISKLSYISLLIIGALFAYYKISDWGTISALISVKYITDMVFVECGQHLSSIQRDLACVDRLLKQQAESEEKLPHKEIYTSNNYDELYNKSIIIKDLTFSYNNKDTIIANLSLVIPNKSFIVLTGESGKGKSTILKIIMGLYFSENGTIEFNGEKESLSLSDIRNKTAYVPQDAMLFSGSICENIKFGNESASMDDVIEASKLAGCDEFVDRLIGGYDYILSDDANNLSGGQKKRIAIARALVKKSEILLLDEITSALDYQTEIQILETIKNISKEKTVIFVTHSKNVEKYADKIFEL